MSSFRLWFGTGVCLLAVASGCASSPWSGSRSTASAPVPAPTPPGLDAQAMQQVLADIRQAGVLDPASQQKLIEDLQQADPKLWPLMAQQFRAQIAYRQRVQAAAAPGGPERPIWGSQAGGAPGSVPAPQASPATQPRANVAQQQPDPRGVLEKPAPPGPKSEVIPASYETPSGDDWQKHVAAAIRDCEARLAASGKGSEDPAAQAQLRMLYLLAGRRDDALRPISSVPASQQGFWSAEIYGLSTWLDTQRTPDESRRAAEAKQHFGEAVVRLGESCPLVVRNLAFCSEIQSYGCFKAFERFEFNPGQAVLLYAEVENLTGDQTERGIHTSLQSSYEIFDSRSQRVADEEFTVTEEYCRNPRRDYFIGYELRLPERIYPGKHVLQLTIRDVKSQKIGQARIDFTVKKK